jgi:ParB family transcriptional regulator, chromosome partitioning protein
VSEAVETNMVLVSPFRCRMWNLHDRDEESITAESCRQEIASFQRYGQLVPVLGRALNNDPAYDIELIFGARRMFVARHLGVPLRVELRSLSDREAIVSMDVENRHRVDISPYERGVAYARWLREGQFRSQDDLANALGISGAQVSKLLKLARLPAVILNAFGHVADIREGWGLELAAVLEDPKSRDRTVRKAREIAREPVRPPAAEVCRQLLTASLSGRKPAAKARDEVVLSEAGAPLFRVRHARKSVMLLLAAERLSARGLRDIVQAVRGVLETDPAANGDPSALNALQMLSLRNTDMRKQPAQVVRANAKRHTPSVSSVSSDIDS